MERATGRKKLDYQVAIWEHEFVNKANNPEQTLTGSQLPVVFTGTLTVLSPGGGRKSALVVEASSGLHRLRRS
jgi:hypothetical protein